MLSAHWLYSHNLHYLLQSMGLRERFIMASLEWPACSHSHDNTEHDVLDGQSRSNLGVNYHGTDSINMSFPPR